MIDETTVKTEATRLREELKRARQQQRDDTRGTDSSTSEGDGGNIPTGDTEAGRSVQVLQRPGTASGRGKRTIRSNGRSTIRGDGRLQGQLEHSGSEHRRPYEQHPSFITSGTVDATEGTGRSVGSRSVVGNFERQDNVPTRQFVDPTALFEQSNPRSEATRKRGPGRPKKTELEAAPSGYSGAENFVSEKGSPIGAKAGIGSETTSEQGSTRSAFSTIKSLIPSGRVKSVLTDAETKGFAPILKGALRDYGRYADQYLNARLSTAGTIWGNLDADELDNLVSAMLSIGKRNGTVAEGVRLVAHSNDYVTTVMILVPRLMQTSQVLQQAPPRPRRTPTATDRGQRFRTRFRSRLGSRIGEAQE